MNWERNVITIKFFRFKFDMLILKICYIFIFPDPKEVVGHDRRRGVGLAADLPTSTGKS